MRSDDALPSAPDVRGVPQRLRRRADASLIALFCVGTALPMLGRLAGWSAPFDAAMEKRPPAPWPGFAMRRRGPLSLPRKSSIAAFPARFEHYFNDRLGFRQEMLSAFATARLAGVVPGALADLSAGRAGACPVLVGRDGWLYYTGERSIESYRCTHPFRDAELDQWRRVLCEQRRRLAERGIELLFVVAPDKHTIYPEHLPRSVNRVGEQSRLDQLLAHLAASDVPTLDLRPALDEAKRARPTYFRADSHWNPWGAFTAYQEIMRHLARSIPTAAPYPLEDFELVAGARYRGDLASMLGAAGAIDDEVTSLVRRGPRSEIDTVIDAQGSPSADGYPVVTVRPRKSKPGAPTALVLHDSFFDFSGEFGIKPFFNEHWSQVTYVLHGRFSPEFIDRMRPRVVILQVAERRLMNIRPAELVTGAGLWASSPGTPTRR